MYLTTFLITLIIIGAISIFAGMIITIIVENEYPILIGLAAFVISVILIIVFAIINSNIIGKDKNFEKVYSADLYERNGNVYYIDPKTDKEQPVNKDSDFDEYKSTIENSHVEWQETNWLCFKVSKVIYYTHIE